MKTAKMDILVGLQWGDEGKGKFIDHICPKYDLVARYNGGANAGHTIFWNDKKVTLKLLPSGIFYPHIQNVIGTGTVVNPSQLRKEITQLQTTFPELAFQDRLYISKKAHLVLPTDSFRDVYMEESADFTTIGTTKNGIGCAYANKLLRQGFRIAAIFTSQFEHDVSQAIRRDYQELDKKGQNMPEVEVLIADFLADVEWLKRLAVIDTEQFLQRALKQGKRLLAEGAQATMLDFDHGSYPYVTSSNTIASAACSSLGIPPSWVGEIYGVMKAYVTRVGDGPFPSEEFDELAEEIRIKGQEYGSNTGRPRRIGWLDLPALRYACMINGVTQLIMTKADVLQAMEEIQLCDVYELNGELLDSASMDNTFALVKPHWKSFKGWQETINVIPSQAELPTTLKQYIGYLEEQLEVPVTFLSTGPKRDDILALDPQPLIAVSEII